MLLQKFPLQIFQKDLMNYRVTSKHDIHICCKGPCRPKKEHEGRNQLAISQLSHSYLSIRFGWPTKIDLGGSKITQNLTISNIDENNAIAKSSARHFQCKLNALKGTSYEKDMII